MNLNHLITKREQTYASAQEILTRAETDERSLTADELAQHADLLGTITSIDATLQAHDAHLAADVASAQPAQAARSAQPGTTDAQAATQAARGDRGTHTDEYRQAFETFMRSGLVTPELRAHTVATDTAGGYTVPDEWEATIVRKLREFTYMRQYAKVIQTSMGTLNIPRETSIGTANWTAEGAAFNENEDVFGNVTLSPHKMSRLVKVSEELLNDSMFDLGDWLSTTFAESFADLEEAAFINGDGSSKPRGVLLDSTAGVTAAATNAITFDEIADLYYSVKPAYRSRSVWLMNDATRKTLSKIKTGVSSDLRYLWTESVSSGQPATLFGRPVISASNMPTIATGVKAVAFGDLSYYWVADKPGIPLQRLNELYAASGLIGFRAFRRTDGELTQAEAVKHLILA